MIGKVRIWQAPTGSIAGPELCSAVSAAGGMGAMGLTWTTPEQARIYVRSVRGAAPNQPFQVNFVLHFEPRALIAVLEEGTPIVTFSWGDPAPYLDLIRSFGTKLGVQVVSRDGARQALDLGADFLVCQGIEAGGHVQSTTPLKEALEDVLQEASGTPVIGAGGLADAEDVAGVLRRGASGAMLGTRFVATLESRAHPDYKQAILEGEDTALTTCFDGGWPQAMHRVLRNSTFRAWEAAGSPNAGRRPGEGEVLGASPGGEIVRYDDTAPRIDTQGKAEAMCLYSGAGCGKIRDLPSAADLVKRLQSYGAT